MLAKLDKPRTVTFKDGTKLTSHLTNEALCYQHGWKQQLAIGMYRGVYTRFTRLVSVPVEGSDFEYEWQIATVAVADADSVTIYVF